MSESGIRTLMPGDIMEKFNKRLKTLRTMKGLTMKEVAQATDVPLSTYREWEYGRAIQGEPYLKIAQALSVSLSELLTGSSRNSEVWRELELIEHHIKNLRDVLSSAL